jgi:hypothetical protein
MEIINNNPIIIKPKLTVTNKFDDIYFYNKTSRKTIKINKLKNILLYKLLVNKYEPITFENINYNSLIFGNKNMELLDKHIYTFTNNVITIGGITLFPVIKGFDMNKMTTMVNPGGLKYYNMAFNPYFKSLKNKKITLIKQIGPWEIINDNLNLYFHEELFLNSNENKTKTIFIYFNWDNKTYKKIVNEQYDYILINDINDKKINEYMKDSDLIIIDNISIRNKYDCLYNIVSFNHILRLVNHVINSINIGCDLAIIHNRPDILPYYQLYYYLFNSFSKLTYHKTQLSYKFNDFFVFESYKHKIDGLSDIISEYDTYDKYNSYNLYIDIQKKWCHSKIEKKDIVTNVMIQKIFDETFSEEFEKFMKKINKINKHEERKYIRKILFIKDQIMIKDNIINFKKIKTILLHNIDKSIAYLKKNNIEINDIYKNNKISNSYKLVKSFFPNIPDNLVNKIHLSRDSIYSVSSYDVAEKTSLLIKQYFKVNKIIDGTANIGGNTMNFADHFDNVVSNELSTDTFNNLKNNINVLGKKNVKLYNESIVDFFNNTNILKDIKYDINQWCLYLDPPWSGVFYKLKENIEMFFGQTNVIEFLNSINVKYICLKVPKNFNLSRLFDIFENIIIHKVKYCYIILITK